MPTIDVFDMNKNKVGDLELDDSVFGAKVNEALLWEAVKWARAKRRRGTASTKTRGEVRGGAAKPFRQKGTGRARQGSIVSNLHRGGGVSFGPKPRSYEFALPKKKRRGALRSALSMRLSEKQIVVLDDLRFEQAKTRDMAALLERFNLGKTLVVDGATDCVDNVVFLATRNIARAKYLPAGALNVYDLMNHETLVLTRAAVESITAHLDESARRQRAAESMAAGVASAAEGE